MQKDQPGLRHAQHNEIACNHTLPTSTTLIPLTCSCFTTFPFSAPSTFNNKRYSFAKSGTSNSKCIGLNASPFVVTGPEPIDPSISNFFMSTKRTMMLTWYPSTYFTFFQEG